MVNKKEVKEAFKSFIVSWTDDYAFKTYFASGFSALLGIIFTVYNGYMGLRYRSIWNGSICVYYVLLAAVRGLIVNSQRNEKARNNPETRKRIVLFTHIIMFLMDLSLVVPIKAMIDNDRSFKWGLVPAIAMAAYTTYRIVMSIHNLLVARKHEDVFVKELRTVFLMDTLFAVLVLQNTLILTNDGTVAGPMKVLSIITSTLICMAIYAISILSFVKSKRAEE